MQHPIDDRAEDQPPATGTRPIPPASRRRAFPHGPGPVRRRHRRTGAALRPCAALAARPWPDRVARRVRRVGHARGRGDLHGCRSRGGRDRRSALRRRRRDGEPLVVPPRPALAADRVRHVGDPIAFVVATSPTAAQDAAEAIAVTFDDLPAVVGAEAALCAGAPCLWDQAPGNLAFRFRKGDRAAVDAAMAAASTIVELTLDNNRVVAAALEPRAAIGTYDPAEDILTLTLTGQGVHEMRRQLADSVFRRPEARIHLVAPDVGGGFGAKNVLYPEWVLVLFAARRLRRPVKWTSSRSEDFLSSAQARDNRTRARLALDRAGRFLALDVETVADMGAYLSALGPLVPTQAAASAMGGVYAIPAMCMDVRGAFTNSVPVDAYRGAGKPEANYLIERLVEVAAARIGMPSMDLRRLNMMSVFPYRSALGMTVERGAFAAHLDTALALSDQAGFAARRAEAARRGGCGVSASAAISRPRGDGRASSPASASRRMGPSACSSGRNRTAKVTRRAFRRSRPTCSACRSSGFGWSRPTRAACRAARGTAGPARSIRAGRRSWPPSTACWRRPARSRASSCNATPPTSSSPTAPSRTPGGPNDRACVRRGRRHGSGAVAARCGARPRLHGREPARPRHLPQRLPRGRSGDRPRDRRRDPGALYRDR